MKKKYIISAIASILVFALTYIYLSFGIVLSLVIGILTYYATYLVIPGKKIVIEDAKSVEEIIDYGYDELLLIKEVLNKLENDKIKNNFNIVCSDVEKILLEVKNKPKKAGQIRNFMSYYLPVSVKILNQYDELENQRLTSKDSRAFMEKVENLSLKIREATANQLNSMYNEELINTGADIKVFETMLKSDGLLDSGKIKIEIKDDEKGKEE